MGSFLFLPYRQPTCHHVVTWPSSVQACGEKEILSGSVSLYLFLPLFIRMIIPSWGYTFRTSSKPVTSKRPHFLIPSLGRLGLQRMNGSGREGGQGRHIWPITTSTPQLQPEVEEVTARGSCRRTRNSRHTHSAQNPQAFLSLTSFPPWSSALQ